MSRPLSLEALCVRAFVRLLEGACSRPGCDGEALHAECARSIPWVVRQRLLEETLKSGRLYDMAQILALEALLGPDLRRLAVRHVRRWYRHRFVELLASGRAAGLRVLLLEDVAWLAGKPVTTAPLAEALRSLRHLRQVSLRFVCDDALLATLGACCPHLREVDAGGANAVSDVGVHKMCLRADVWTSSRPLDSEKRHGCLDGVSRACRGVFLSVFLENALNLQNALPQWWRNSVIKCACRNPCCKTLRVVDFSATRVTRRGIELFRSCAPWAQARV